jgi:hypothetical protein
MIIVVMVALARQTRDTRAIVTVTARGMAATEIEGSLPIL